MTISALIVDDEPLARKRIRRLLTREADVVVVGESDNGIDAVDAIQRLRPDLVFLDVQLPELDGFGVLKQLDPELIPTVVFVTAYNQYAISAFDVHALDYLLKPFSATRFRTACQRARAQLERNAGGGAGEQVSQMLVQMNGHGTPAEGYIDRLMVRVRGKVVFVKVSEVDWVEAAGNYVRLHIGSEAHLVRGTMSMLETRLDPRMFGRVHRSTIVNFDRVKEMEPWFSGEYTILLRNGVKLKLSRWYRERLEERMPHL